VNFVSQIVSIFSFGISAGRIKEKLEKRSNGAKVKMEKAKKVKVPILID